MAKNFWFKFEWSDWLNDEALLGCSLETQGFWIRCVAMMHRAGVSEFTGTVDQLRRKFGILPEELVRCLEDLKSNNAADVRFGKENVSECKGDVSIKSRRLERALKAKEMNRLYVASHRAGKDGKAESKVDVRTQSKSKSNIKSKKEEREASQAPPTTTEKPRKGTRIPKPFELTAEMRAYASTKRPGVDVDLETEKFINYFTAASGSRGTKLDWLATWRNWILNSFAPNAKPAVIRFDPGKHRPDVDPSTIEPCHKCGLDVCLGGPSCEERARRRRKPSDDAPGAYVN